ncbi:hypothetical protein TESG_08300 [Trichophyton tonsurans CBS 112818]|uniref:Uncharacterized protein n=1 Tax=Trichophyton tonsurans (strain CBS 112818) TaxID=647933 RepID=F2RR17_TRIT1|nr:hypothetical protein TESG_08300 [Trichophyton tonsurans CBS 112818]
MAKVLSGLRERQAGGAGQPGVDENRPCLIERPWNRCTEYIHLTCESRGRRDGRTRERERVQTKELREYLGPRAGGGPVKPPSRPSDMDGDWSEPLARTRRDRSHLRRDLGLFDCLRQEASHLRVDDAGCIPGPSTGIYICTSCTAMHLRLQQQQQHNPLRIALLQRIIWTPHAQPLL